MSFSLINAAENRLSSLGARGYSVLDALAAPHGIDRYLELVDPLLAQRELRAEVTDVRHQTSDTVTLALRTSRRWSGFTAGQYVRLTVEIDGVRHTRCYSPACSALRADGQVELTIKHQPDGLVSGYLKRRAVAGLVVGLSEAAGTFSLPQQRPERLVLMSGGSGITPVMSILRTLCDEGYSGPIAFVHYSGKTSEVPYLDELRSLEREHPNVRVLLGLIDEPEKSDLHGFFSVEHLEAADSSYGDAQTYLCGPGGLMRSVRDIFTDVGLADQLHTEDFAPAAPAPTDPDADATGQVEYARSGLSSSNTGQTLLEQAEAAGLSPEHGCRMGICFSCTQVKKSGCVRNIQTGALSSDEDEEIQLCVSAPVGDVSIEL